ncbi:Peroxidasin-like protein, partial [Stegodyphus mimosarum]
MDLVSLNLQRGRDHGLPPYNEYRALCNKTRAKHFNDLKEDIPEHIVERIKNVYE